MKLNPTAVGITVVGTLALAGCGGGSSGTPTSSKPVTSSASAAGIPDAATLAQAKASASGLSAPPAVGTPKWSDADKFIGAAGSVVVFSPKDVEGTDGTMQDPHLAGLSTATGKPVWRLDLTQPPGRKLTGGDGNNAEPNATVTVAQIGTSLVVTWAGFATTNGLDVGKAANLVALYSMATGKQIGTTTDLGATVPSGKTFGVALDISPMPQGTDSGNPPAGDTLLFPNGSTAKVAPTPTHTAAAAFTASKDPEIDISTVPVNPTTRVITWSSQPGGIHRNSPQYFVTSPLSTLKKSGSPQACGHTDDNSGNAVSSPDGTWVLSGLAVLNTATPGTLRCLESVSDSPITVYSIAQDGSVYGKANDRPFSLPANTTKPVVLPTGTTLPTTVLPTGAVFKNANNTYIFYAK